MSSLISLKGHLDKDQTARLENLAKNFPAELRRALAGVGFHMKRKVQSAMRAGGPKGHKWKKLSTIQIYKRLDAVKSGKDISLKRRSKKRLAAAKDKGQHTPEAMTRWRGGPKRGETSMGRMLGGIRYKEEQSKLGVIIGGFGPGSERYLRAVQTGGVLTGGENPTFVGSMPITPKMRRLFFAAGIPLKKGRTSLSFPARPLIRPVFELHINHIYRYMQLAVKNYVEDLGMKRDTIAAQAGFNTSFY